MRRAPATWWWAAYWAVRDAIDWWWVKRAARLLLHNRLVYVHPTPEHGPAAVLVRFDEWARVGGENGEPVWDHDHVEGR